MICCLKVDFDIDADQNGLKINNFRRLQKQSIVSSRNSSSAGEFKTAGSVTDFPIAPVLDL